LPSTRHTCMEQWTREYILLCFTAKPSSNLRLYYGYCTYGHKLRGKVNRRQKGMKSIIIRVISEKIGDNKN
jgi:hypothetical protein